jgi:hypothetical protein
MLCYKSEEEVSSLRLEAISPYSEEEESDSGEERVSLPLAALMVTTEDPPSFADPRVCYTPILNPSRHGEKLCRHSGG